MESHNITNKIVFILAKTCGKYKFGLSLKKNLRFVEKDGSKQRAEE